MKGPRQVRIASLEGVNDAHLGHQVRVFGDDGKELPNVRSIVVRARVDDVVRAEVEVMPTAIDVVALATVREVCPGCGAEPERVLDALLAAWDALKPEVPLDQVVDCAYCGGTGKHPPSCTLIRVSFALALAELAADLRAKTEREQGRPEPAPVTGEPKLEVFGVVADKAFPEKGEFFRSDAERRRFLAALRQRDLANRTPLLQGQRRRVWLARARAFWLTRSAEILAALIVVVAIGLMAFPAEAALRSLAGFVATLFGCWFIWICGRIRRDRRRRRGGRQ